MCIILTLGLLHTEDLTNGDQCSGDRSTGKTVLQELYVLTAWLAQRQGKRPHSVKVKVAPVGQRLDT